MPDPKPTRIGDAERDAAVESLRDHLVAGRLTQIEFDERMSVALDARFRSELSPLFVDLPSGNEPVLAYRAAVPAVEVPASSPARRRDFRPVISALVWISLIGFIIWTRGAFWWLVFFAGGITGGIYAVLGVKDEDEKQALRIQEIHLERQVLKEERKLLEERRRLAVLRGEDLTELDQQASELDAADEQNRRAERRYQD